LSSLAQADTGTMRDPTMPIGKSVSVNSNNSAVVVLQLNSILISQQRRLAVINGQSLRQGDDIKGTGFRVTAIDAHSVRVQSNQTTRVLSLVNTKVKK
jgi:MSHA biogenesis protein MshK